MPNEILNRIRSGRWRQGHVLPAEANAIISDAIDRELQETDACIVVTQSCNIVHEDFEAEPVVEVLVCRRLTGGPEGSVASGRSPRRIHFNIVCGDSETAYEALARDRAPIPRQVLAEFTPDKERQVSEQTLRTLVGWLVARYDRTAFPDEFQHRLNSVKDKLKKQFDHLQKVPQVFVALNTWDELPVATPYRVSVVFVMPVADYENVGTRSRTEAVIAKISEVLEYCAGIELDESCSLVPEDQFTFHDARSMRRWGDFDYLSYRNQEMHSLPPAG